LGVRGLKSKIEQQFIVEGVMENWRSKNGSISSRNKKKKNQFEVCDRQTDGHRQTESTTKNNRLLG